jgi:FkbM family methyltransferase
VNRNNAARIVNIRKIRWGLNAVSWTLAAPLNQKTRIAALRRMVRWQVGSRLLGRPAIHKFVNDTRLLVAPSATGATLNIYGGLHEFEDMSFVCHCLRPGDLFLDVGANVGSYTVLAAGVAGANVMAFEPILATYNALVDNVRLNGINHLVQTINSGVGDKLGDLKFLAAADAMNRVATADDADLELQMASIVTLDSQAPRPPAVVKIDVEGWETEVVRGGMKLLASPDVLALIVELNGSGSRYGTDERELLDLVHSLGFEPARYFPNSRRLDLVSPAFKSTGNQLLVRNIEEVRTRLQGARPFVVLGREI